MAPFAKGPDPVFPMDLFLRPRPCEPVRPLRRTARLAACALLALGGAHAVQAQAQAQAEPQAVAAVQAGPAQLGMTLAELQAVYPSLERMPRPVMAPHGLRGQWRLTDTLVAGLPFETIFFFRGQRVQRIEQLGAEEAQPCAPQQAFAAVVNATGLGYGGGQSGMDAFGTAGGADVSAHLQITSAACAIRVVYKPTVLKDGSTL